MERSVGPMQKLIESLAGDPQKLAFHAHALRSMSLNLGCTGIIEVAQKLDAALKEVKRIVQSEADREAIINRILWVLREEKT